MAKNMNMAFERKSDHVSPFALAFCTDQGFFAGTKDMNMDVDCYKWFVASDRMCWRVPRIRHCFENALK